MKFKWTAGRRLALSLTFGLLAFALSAAYLKGERRKIESQFQMTKILRAKKYIAEGQTLTPQLFEESSMPTKYAPHSLASLKELADSSGRAIYRAKTSFRKGEYAVRSLLEETRDPLGLAWTLPAGDVALTLRLSAEQAVGGFIQPGDRVNVYALFDRQPSWPQEEVRELLKGVPVCAMGENVWDPDRTFAPGKFSKKVENDLVLVTLCLKPKDAALVHLASQKSALRLGLVSAAEKSSGRQISLTMNDLKRKY